MYYFQFPSNKKIYLTILQYHNILFDKKMRIFISSPILTKNLQLIIN